MLIGSQKIDLDNVDPTTEIKFHIASCDNQETKSYKTFDLIWFPFQVRGFYEIHRNLLGECETICYEAGRETFLKAVEKFKSWEV